MPTIKVRVDGKIAENLTPEIKIVCGNEDYEVEFQLDEPWSSVNFKTGLFIFNGDLVAQPFDGNVCPMPSIEDTTLLAIGVKSSDGRLFTTTPAFADCLKSASDLARNKIPAPAKDVYDEIIALLNKYIEQVGGGGGLTEEQVKEIVQETLPDWVEQPEKPTYTYEEITEKPTLVEQIDASVNEQTLSLTIDLKDKDGNVLSTKTIVLPISNPDLTDYVKFTDIPSDDKAGVVRVSLADYGLQLYKNNIIVIRPPSDWNILYGRKDASRSPVTLSKSDMVVKETLTNPLVEWTDEDKAKVRALLGIE